MTKILFIELLGGLGDLVIALPAIHALALSHPQSRLSVLTFSPGAELLEADPLVHRIFRAQRGDAADPERPRRAVEALLAEERFDLIVSDTRYAGIDALVQASGARSITNLWRQPPADELIERRFLQILHDEGLVASWVLSMKPRVSLDAIDRMCAAARFGAEGRRALLHPHAGMPIKVWPVENYVALGKALRDEYGMDIVIPEGTGSEVTLSHEIARALGPRTILLPSDTLRSFAAATAHIDLVVGADTGPVRAASAVGALTIMLLGPTWQGRYGQQPPHANLQGHPGCPLRVVGDFTQQPCWYSGTCALGIWPSCMHDISVGDVLEVASRLLQRTSWWGKPLPERAADIG